MSTPTTPTKAGSPGHRDATDTAGASIHSRRWWILAVVAIAQLMVVLDATIVNIALPTAQQDIGFSNDSRQWVVTTYALAFGSLLLLGGRLGDLLGRRATFMAGLLGFAAFSAVGGAASSLSVLLIARGGQGVFGALLAPAALSLLTTTFTDTRERGKAFAIYGALSGAGGAIGLVLGGALTEYLSWRWCMFVNVPIAVIALLGAFVLLPRLGRDATASLDVPGVVFSVAGLVSLVYGLSHAETNGWSAATTLGFIVAGIALLAVFCWLETRSTHPLLPMSVLLDRNRGGAFISLAVVGAGMFGVFLFLTYYLSAVVHMTPLTTGLAFLPMIGGITVTAQISPALVARSGAKIPTTVGFVTAAAGMLLLAQLELTSSYAAGVLPGLIVVGLGVGLVLPSAMNAAVDRVDDAHAGVASAAVSTFQQIGGSIGTAVLSAAAASAAATYLTNPDASDGAVAATASLHSYTTAFLWSAAFFLTGAVMSTVLLRRGRLVTDPETAAVMAH